MLPTQTFWVKRPSECLPLLVTCLASGR
eukprot:symbB.v1.2.040691.t1/scaffold7445.1/size11222/1